MAIGLEPIPLVCGRGIRLGKGRPQVLGSARGHARVTSLWSGVIYNDGSVGIEG